MKTNSMISVVVAVSAALAVAMPGLGAAVHAQTAQTPAPPVQQAPAVPVQPKINLTLEQRHTIKELIKDVNVPPAPKNV
jgi:hypothetical protein